MRLTLPPLGEARSAHGGEPSFWRARADRPWGAAALVRFGTTASRALPAKPQRALATGGEVALAASALAEVHQLVPSRWLSSRTLAASASVDQRRRVLPPGPVILLCTSEQPNLAARAGKEQKPWAHDGKSIRRTCSSASITR